MLNWRFERILDLGSDTGRTAFFRISPTSVGVDSVGTMYVLDAGNYSISVFDRAGRHVRSFGRHGEGPGEMGFPSDMAVSTAGEVAVYDFARRALLRFAPNGTFTGAFPIPGPLQRKVSLLNDGSIVAAVTQSAGMADSTDYRVIAMLADTLEIARVRQFSGPQRQQVECTSLALPPYFGPRIIWAAAGERVAVNDNTTYSIRIVDRDGSKAVWRRAVPEIRSTLDLAAWEVAQGDSFRFRGPVAAQSPPCVLPAEDVARKFGYADIVPIVTDLEVTPAGGVWVRRRTEVPGEWLIDILDPTGAYVGTVPGESPFPALFRGEDEIVTVERDDLDVPHIVVYRIRR